MSLLNPYLIKKPNKIPARNAVREGMSQNAPAKGAATSQPKGKPARAGLTSAKPHSKKGKGTLVD